MATCKNWTRTLKNLDPENPGLGKTWTQKHLNPEKPGSWKIWTLINFDHKKHGINIGLKFILTLLIEWTNLLRIKCLNISSLNIRSSRLEESCKKIFLTIFQNSLKNIKNIRYPVFNLKFQAKESTIFLKRDSDICAFLRIWQKF